MKLILAIVQDQDAPKLIDRLMKSNYGVTKLASTGGFLRSGNTTLMIGVEKDNTEDVIDIIKSVCRSRKEMVTPLPMGGPGDSYVGYPVEVTVGGATVFVLNVERFEKV